MVSSPGQISALTLTFANRRLTARTPTINPTVSTARYEPPRLRSLKTLSGNSGLLTRACATKNAARSATPAPSDA
ncbi:hypothetical protein JOF29_006804 [Kribbella aluminosa]|uniref:Uncharacterized protein n=1 Tax=Kribbella aluminosa TaxID=416017 RepID=A0ABS4UVM3_9ACTN|nr:hypothetical protein [Kribbella aluminosa]